jgi:hypothetical protein
MNHQCTSSFKNPRGLLWRNTGSEGCWAAGIYMSAAGSAVAEWDAVERLRCVAEGRAAAGARRRLDLTGSASLGTAYDWVV